MSKIAIKGNESGTATFTIEAPATNTDRIFELPDEAGKVLTSASNLAGVTGVGKVLQVVEAISNTTTKATSSTSYVSATTNASITPSSASNKILIQWCGHPDTVTQGRRIEITVFRGATNLATENGSSQCFARVHDVAAGRFLINQNFILLDSPNTTSSVTYTIFFRSTAGAGDVRIRDDVQRSRLVLMEIAA